MRCPTCNQKANQNQLLHGKEWQDKAIPILDFLNDKKNSGMKGRGNHGYPHVIHNLKGIIKLLKQGYTEQEFYSVIAMKVREWKRNPEFRKYLRPDTLFSENFHRYVGELGED